MKKLYLILFVLVCYQANAQWKYANYPNGGTFWYMAATKNAAFVHANDIFVSTDNGKQWNKSGLGLPPYGVLLAANKNKVFTMSVLGVYASTDDGKSWSFSGDGISDTLYVTAIATEDSIVLAGTSDRYLYRSTDNGVTWKLLNMPPDPFNLFFRIVLKGNCALASTFTGLMLSTDKGETWTDSLDGLPPQTPQSFTITKTKLFVDYGIEQYSSTDQGATWQLASTNLPADASTYDIAVDDSVIYHGSTAGLHISKDGENFQHVSSGLPDEFTATAFAVNEGGVYMGTSKHLYYSADQGKNWVLRDSGIFKISVGAMQTDKGRLLTGGSSGIIISDDDNQTWQERNKGIGQDSRCIAFTALDSMTFMATNLEIFSSIDQGDTWQQQASGLPPYFYMNELRAYQGNVYCASVFDGVYRSKDKGANWEDISGDLPAMPNVNAVGFHNATIFAGVSWKGTYRSTNEGQNWELVNGIDATVITKFETIADVIWASSNEGLYKSEDDGVNWTKVQNAPSGYITELYYMKGLLWISYDKDIWISADWGDTWISVRNGLPPDTDINCLMTKGDFIYAGTDDGVWVRNLNEIITGINENKGTSDFHIYPNPGNGLFYIKSGYTTHQVELVNMLGQKVYAVDLNAGESQLDLRHLAKGMYMLQVINERQISINKKIVIR